MKPKIDRFVFCFYNIGHFIVDGLLQRARIKKKNYNYKPPPSNVRVNVGVDISSSIDFSMPLFMFMEKKLILGPRPGKIPLLDTN